jgi:peptide/nickel transport system permease protein
MKDDNGKKKRKSSFFALFMQMLFGSRVSNASIMEEEQIQSPFKTIMREFFRRKLTIVGLVGFFTMLLASTIIPFFWRLDLREHDASQRDQAPSMNMMRIPRSIRNTIDMVSAGPGYGVALTHDNRLHAWGTVRTVAQPLLDEVPQTHRPIREISTGTYHAVAVTVDGHLLSWGNNDPSMLMNAVPPEIQGRVVTAEAGNRMTIAITTDNQLHSWGGTRQNRDMVAATGRVPRTEVPVMVRSNGLTFGVLTASGNVYILMRTPHMLRDVPEEIQGRIVDFTMTELNIAALLDDGTVAVWGDPSKDLLMNVPAHIHGRVTAIESGREHFLVLLNDGTVYGWGIEQNNRLRIPRNLSNVVAISVANDHNYAMLADGSITTWGLRGFIFGTDFMGRCVWTRMWGGGRYTLLIGMVAVIVQGIIGVTLGGFGGYFGGKADMFIMRFAEVVGSLPFLPIAIILQWRFRGHFGEIGSMIFVMVVLGVLSWPPLMRLVRAQFLQARASEYVLAARALGVKQVKLIFRHIMPNVASMAIVSLTLALAGSMLTETGLSFLGFGVSSTYPTWGNILNAAGENTLMLRNQWWAWVFPAIALVTVTLSINFVGDGLREATDPRSQGR